MKTLKRPADIITSDDLLMMESDNLNSTADEWSILHTGKQISLHAPNGTGHVEIPTKDFKKICQWFMTPQIKGETQ